MVVGKSRLKCLICYASQKGTAQSIAEDILENCSEHDLSSTCDLCCISDIKSIHKLKDYCCTVFIGSTTGDGDPPETARKFMRDLKSEAAAENNYSWLHYTVLGLGDTNYTNFCNFGKTLNKTLEKLKAQRFYDCGWADDGTGLEIVVEPWIEGLFPAIKLFLKSYISKTECSLINEDINVDLCASEKHSSSSFSKVEDKDMANYSFLHTIPEKKTPKSYSKLTSLFPTLGLPNFEELKIHPLKTCEFSHEKHLTIPALPSSFLKVEFSNEESSVNHLDILKQKSSVTYPFASSEIIECKIDSWRKLTSDDAVKRALEINLKAVSNETKFEYEPGDSFGLVVKNKTEEVNLLLTLLEATEKADLRVKFSVDPSTSKKSACIPKFIPEECTLKYLFTHCLDIRNIPKKTFLRSLIEYTVDPSEKRRLMELVSKEGSNLYNEIVRQQGLTFLDFLLLFQSCTPPLSLVIENLPRLQPRSYSITSSPLLTPETISFVFNVIEIPQGGSIMFHRQGLCTGWLDDLTKRLLEKSNESIVENLTKEVGSLKLEPENESESILIYLRSNKNFRMPKEINTPILMIGPGTGVAPFIGFLKHREIQLKSYNVENWPIMYLFFGCRHQNKDFLFKSELKYFEESGILKNLLVSFSRDNACEGQPKYVQDNLVLNGNEIIDCIDKHNAYVYVCGDAKNMSRNVFDTFIHLIQKHLELNEIEARKYMAQMQLNGRYLQDVWA